MVGAGAGARQVEPGRQNAFFRARISAKTATRSASARRTQLRRGAHGRLVDPQERVGRTLLVDRRGKRGLAAVALLLLARLALLE
jgi:hypothetical protein